MPTLYKRSDNHNQVSSITFDRPHGGAVVFVKKCVWDDTGSKVLRDEATVGSIDAIAIEGRARDKGYAECTHPSAFEDRCCTCGQHWNQRDITKPVKVAGLNIISY